jgi:hypothetical protein
VRCGKEYTPWRRFSFLELGSPDTPLPFTLNVSSVAVIE